MLPQAAQFVSLSFAASTLCLAPVRKKQRSKLCLVSLWALQISFDYHSAKC